MLNAWRVITQGNKSARWTGGGHHGWRGLGTGGMEEIEAEWGKSHFLTSFDFVHSPSQGDLVWLCIGCVGLTPATVPLTLHHPSSFLPRDSYSLDTWSKVLYLLAHCLSLLIWMKMQAPQGRDFGSLHISNALTSAWLPDSRVSEWVRQCERECLCVWTHTNLEWILWPLALCLPWLCCDDSSILLAAGFLSEWEQPYLWHFEKFPSLCIIHRFRVCSGIKSSTLPHQELCKQNSRTKTTNKRLIELIVHGSKYWWNRHKNELLYYKIS